jgi:hypothetical protein
MQMQSDFVVVEREGGASSFDTSITRGSLLEAMPEWLAAKMSLLLLATTSGSGLPSPLPVLEMQFGRRCLRLNYNNSGLHQAAVICIPDYLFFALEISENVIFRLATPMLLIWLDL